MITNINDIDKAMTDYIKNTIRAASPTIDLSDNSPVSDLVIRPMSWSMAPVMDILSRLEFASNLDNAAYISESDLDSKIQGNYGIYRNDGRRARGSVVFSFAYSTGVTSIEIPQAVSVGTDSGLSFLTTERINISSDMLPAHYNPGSFKYEVVVGVEAAEVGNKYNVDAFKIKRIKSNFSQSVESVSNTLPTEGGTDKESNSEYAARAKSYPASIHLGTEGGYRNAIINQFPEARDVLVVGMGNPLMTRDVYGLLVNGVPTDVHMGGKTDIYIRGYETSSETVTLEAKSQMIMLEHEYSGEYSGDDALKVTNSGVPITELHLFSDPDDDLITWIYIPEFEADNSTRNWEYGDTVLIKYKDAGGINRAEEHQILAATFKPIAPFMDIVSIVNKTRNEAYDMSFPGIYEMSFQEGLEGTNLEDGTCSVFYPSSLTPPYFEPVKNGDILEVTYRYNKTVHQAAEMFLKRGERIITTDILVAKAEEIYIHIELSIKLRPGVSEGADKVSAIREAIGAYFSRLKMGSMVTESEIISAIMSSPETSQFVAYIKLPFTTIAGTPNADDNFVSGVHAGDVIAMQETQFPVLKYCVVNYV